MSLFGFGKNKPDFSEDIVYYAFDINTHLFRFYSDGTVLELVVEGDALSQLDKILKHFNKENKASFISKGHFQSDGHKISFEIIHNGDSPLVCDGDIQSNGELFLSLYNVGTKKKGRAIIKPIDSKIKFDWKNTTDKASAASKTAFFDLRLSSTKQLERLVGKENLTTFDMEFLEDSDTALPDLVNDFLKISGKELPGAYLKINTKENAYSIVIQDKIHELGVGDRMNYVTKNQLLKDINTILGENGSSKRFFYYHDHFDFGQDNGYFYTDKVMGLRLIQILEDPPFYPYHDFKDHSCNRIIDIEFIDSNMEKKARYFKKIIADF